LAFATAFLVGTWKARRLGEEYAQFWQLGRMTRPVDPVAADVWPWMRAVWWSLLLLMAFAACGFVFALVS
jgi:hypothetical protein